MPEGAGGRLAQPVRKGKNSPRNLCSNLDVWMEETTDFCLKLWKEV
jgi:hypothetical protein